MNLLIVDDDELLIKNIIEGIDWKSIGIASVLEANNIRKAQSILEKLPIHILLTDIEMPQGSGLELLEWIREKDLPIECIILSSYAYFAYAQKAIQLHSQEYLLKPVKNSELAGVLGRVAEKAKSTIDNDKVLLLNRKLDFWKKYISEGLFSFTNSELYKEYENSRISIEIIRILPEKDKKEANNISQTDFVIKNVSMEYFAEMNLSPEAILRRSDYEWILIFKINEQYKNIREILMKYHKYLKDNLNLGVFIYAGKVCPMNKLEQSWNKLREIINKGVMNEENILFEEQWKINDKPYIELPWEKWKWEMLHSENLTELKMELINTVQQMVQKNEASIETFVHFRKNLFILVSMFLSQIGIESKQIFESKEFDKYYELSAKSISAMVNYITYIFYNLSGFLCLNKQNESPVDQIKKYIQNNLNEDLSRSCLAKQVFLSEDYISKIFIKEVGMSLPAYITELRMNKAMEYLGYSDASVSEIAVKVGYSNFSYFSKSFKDYYRCTPNEYRINKKLK